VPNSTQFHPTYDQPNPRERKMPNWKLDDATVAVVWDEDAPDEPEFEPDEDFDPAEHTIDEVKAFVADWPDSRADVLEAEEAGKNRVTLVEWLSEDE
jgi:hypothetical protein